MALIGVMIAGYKETFLVLNVLVNAVQLTINSSISNKEICISCAYYSHLQVELDAILMLENLIVISRAKKKRDMSR